MKNSSSHSVHTRHIPQRTCIGCQQVRAKREMIRIVNTPNSNIEIDVTGRKAGRGTYLCPTLECWETGLKSNRLDHALRTGLSKDSREQLLKYAEENLQGETSAPGKTTR